MPRISPSTAFAVPLAFQCCNPDSCRCARRQAGEKLTIVADSNMPGLALPHFVPELAKLGGPRTSSSAAYCAANEHRDEVAIDLRDRIARVEYVPPSDVLITPALMTLFKSLPIALGCKSIVKITGDFRGYETAIGGLPVHHVFPDFSHRHVDPAVVAAAVKGKEKPVVYTTFPVTNPGQQRTSLEIVEATLTANSEATVVIDNAYGGFGGERGLAAFARSTPRVIYLQTGSKYLFDSGRFGWAVGHADLRKPMLDAMSRFDVGSQAADHAVRLLDRPAVLSQMRAVVVRARTILEEKLGSLASLVTGVGPWVLFQAGDHAAEVVAELRDTYNIHVQLQDGPLKGWIRISATCPCEAALIAHAVESIVTDLRDLKQFLAIVGRSPRSQSAMKLLFRNFLADAQTLADQAWAPLLDPSGQ